MKLVFLLVLLAVGECAACCTHPALPAAPPSPPLPRPRHACMRLPFKPVPVALYNAFKGYQYEPHLPPLAAVPNAACRSTSLRPAGVASARQLQGLPPCGPSNIINGKYYCMLNNFSTCQW